MAKTIQTELVVDGEAVHVSRKRVKRMTMRLKSPEGPVFVTAPYLIDDYTIAQYVRSQRAWIAQRRQALAASTMARASDASPQEIEQWRQVVKAVTPPLVEKWERILGVRAGKLVFRNMTSLWGSCQPKTGRICINIRLALYPPECLEYIVVHELCHLIEGGHGPRFKALLDTYLPDWKKRRAKLR